MTKKDLKIKLDPGLCGIVANTIGELTESDIEEWSQNLLNIMHNNPQLKKFNLLVNGDGYFPTSLNAHKKFNQFLRTNKIITEKCHADAFVHHDPNHIEEVQPLSTELQKFFNSYSEAYNWLKELKFKG